MNILSEIDTNYQNYFYTTSKNLSISRQQNEIDLKDPADYLLPKLDAYKGGFFLVHLNTQDVIPDGILVLSILL